MKRNTTPTKSQKAKAPANALWGGRFDASPDALMRAINNSLDVDARLYAQDIAGSVAHASMLARQKIISPKEAELMVRGLIEIGQEIEQGKFPFREEYEDIHMNIEMRLKEKIGETAGRLHTARSRNDQVATDFRLWVRGAIDALDGQLKSLQASLLDKAEKHAATVMPGFTHLQTAQPVTLGHHLMAYVEMIGRDRGRFADCRKRLNESPLGAAALAGTSFPIDRDKTAKDLEFDAPMNNSLDAVSARDFAIEFLAAAAICATNLSRFAEEMIIWSSAPFGFIRFSDKFSTGSSIMPQKRNPDAAELLRAKTGGINGNLVALLTVMKGLPLAYNKDMQEDKRTVFDAYDALHLSVRVASGMVKDFAVDAARMKAAAEDGYATATDLADWLVQECNLPFRDAHHVTGQIVRLAAKKNCALDKLSLKDMQGVYPKITQAVFARLKAESSVASRDSFGGTAPAQVKKQIQAARKTYL